MSIAYERWTLPYLQLPIAEHTIVAKVLNFANFAIWPKIILFFISAIETLPGKYPNTKKMNTDFAEKYEIEKSKIEIDANMTVYSQNCTSW